ncbi:hypothetical protein [Arthrobacter pascens]|uniref:hypothetical protein n=1 Tax=Arthrobacter pascens TaxID=1677 RepID=UPI0027D8E19B|nr:hypothetical protein [Arthrobacter pascens]
MFLLLLFLVGGHVMPAQATTDTTGPVVVSSAITPTTADVSTGAGVFTINLELTDETGVDAPLLRLIHYPSGQYQLQRLALSTGTIQQGVWAGTISVPHGAAAGDWTLETVGLADTLGNKTGGFVKIETVAVVSPAADGVGPVLLSSYLSPTSLDVSAGPATVNVSLRITDDTGVAAPLLRLIHYQSGQYQLQRLVLGSGTIQSGVWKGSITLPKGAAAGKWALETVGLEDTLGNKTGEFVQFRTVGVISAASDSTGPAILSSYLSPTTLNVAAAAATVNVSVRITDDTGVDAPLLRLIHYPSGQYRLQRLTLGSGTIQGGVWKGSITLPQGAAAGKWSLETVGLADTLGNKTGEFVQFRSVSVVSAVAG